MKYLCWHGGKYCSSVATSKITTHYTVHPRENDPRWKGMFKIRYNIVQVQKIKSMYIYAKEIKKKT